MNKINLLKMADYIETIPQKLFNMDLYRLDNFTSHKCDSVGCIIGHCTVLDNPVNIPYKNGEIDFHDWSYEFTEINFNEWEYLFSYHWANVDNTPTGAAKRIRYFVENGIPTNWHKEMFEKKPLSYI